MTPRVDIGREACERMARMHDLTRFTIGMRSPEHDATSALILALRAALDAAERERDEARTDCDGLGHHVAILLQQYLDAMNARDTADATGYARGVRDAAAEAYCEITCDACRRDKMQCRHAAAILALLPADAAAWPTPDEAAKAGEAAAKRIMAAVRAERATATKKETGDEDDNLCKRDGRKETPDAR